MIHWNSGENGADRNLLDSPAHEAFLQGKTGKKRIADAKEEENPENTVIFCSRRIHMRQNADRKTAEIRKVTYVKYVRREKSFVQKLHCHAAFGHELVYVDYGQVDVLLDDKVFLLNTGDCILIRGGTKHMFTGKKERPFSYLNAMFRGTIDESLYGTVLPVSRNVRRVLEQLKTETENESDNFLKEELVRCRFTELILQLLRSCMRKAPAAETGEAGRPAIHSYLPSNTRRHHAELVKKALEIIRENYARPLDMGKVAGALNVSKSHLRALLRRDTGKNFTTLLHETRIEAAKFYLQEGSASLAEIAGAVGYVNPAFFFQLFKRRTGYTPREYSAMLGEIHFEGTDSRVLKKHHIQY